jgi:serine phosphatase RsbU (regulator of sigma subunit)
VKHDVAPRVDRAAPDAVVPARPRVRPAQDGHEKRGRRTGARAGGNGRAARAPATDGPRPELPNATRVDAGFFGWDVATGQVVCEPNTYRLHGLPVDGSATMDTFLSRVPAGDRDHVAEALRQMMGSCGSYQFEYRVTGHDGSLRWMEARGHVLPGPDGRAAKLIGFVTDTTATRATRDAERRRLHEGAERASRTHTFTAALASAVTVEDITSAAQAGLAAYGANGLIMVADHDGRRAVVAAYGFGPEAVRSFGHPERPPGSPVADAIADQSAVYLCSRTDIVHRYPYLAGIAARSAQQSWVAIPVPDSKGRFGACLIGFPEPHEFPAEERALLFAASGLLAQSLERARMYESEHALARELQRGLLPRGPLVVPGMTVAARYEPATSGMEIGGDFYDAIDLANGRVALVIGDVQGHNLIAASLMGQLRTVVDAYAREGHGPAGVMTRANRWLAGLNTDLDTALFATCCFVVIDPARGELTMCRAGHPAPALVVPGAAPMLLEWGDGLPLGVDAAARYRTAEMTVPPGTTLVLATDGLLDADGSDPDANVRHVLRVLGEGAADDLEALTDRLLTTPQRLTRHGDDVALLVARVDGAAVRA